LRTEARGPQRVEVRIVETDRPVRIEGGEATIDGTGLTAELSRDLPRARIEKDVRGTLRREKGKEPVRLRCDGPAFLEALERPARTGRAASREGLQPWRATFRDSVHVEDGRTTLTADEAAVEFVRTTAADQAAGAEKTVVRRMTAIGDVVVEGTDESGGFRATSERLTRFAEDVLTEVSVFEGSPHFTFETKTEDGATRPSLFDVTCTGPARLRERRARLDSKEPERVTVTFEGEVVALQTDRASGSFLSEIRAPLLTIEGRRGADGKFEPLEARAEQGAELRRADVSARARNIVWTARRPGADDHVALVSEPLVRFTEKGGTSPFGGQSRPGVLELRSKEKIDIDFAPPRRDADRTGPPRKAAVLGGMLLRKLDLDDRELWRLQSDRGDALFGDGGEIRDLRAWGDARLENRDGRGGFVAGDRIGAVRRPEATSDRTRAADLDVTVLGSDERPAIAALDGDTDALHHEIRARTLRHERGGRVVVATGAATADLDVPGGRSSADPRAPPAAAGLRLRAEEIRADVDFDGEKPKALRLLTATGAVAIEEPLHRLLADRAVYELPTGRAEAWGDPVRILRHRGKDPKAPAAAPDLGGSHLVAKHVRATFDREAKGPDRFVRATCPEGGTLVASHLASPDGSDKARARTRLTMTSTGPLDLERDAATAVGDVVAVWEEDLPDGRRRSLGRIDAARMEAAFGPWEPPFTRDDVRSLTATGTPENPARLHARDPKGGREVVALAERMEMLPARTKVRMSCPSGRSRVFVHEVVEGRKLTCDSATYDYQTGEVDEIVRPIEVE